jgi:hypothetical protein
MGQLKHWAKPGSGAYSPSPHEKQLMAPPDAAVPGSQRVQLSDPVSFA